MPGARMLTNIVTSILAAGVFVLWWSSALHVGEHTVFRVRASWRATARGASHTTVQGGPVSNCTSNTAFTWPSPLGYSSWEFKGVQPPAASNEGTAQLVPLCNASYVRQHPLTSADYERSYIPGHPCSLPPELLSKLLSGQPVTIIAIGGSMTFGRKCQDGNRWMADCAWASRVQDRLRETFPNGNITVLNKAMPGFNYRHWLASGLLEYIVQAADVIICDDQVNSYTYVDAYRQMEDVDEFLYAVRMAAHRKQQPVGVLFTESFVTCFNDPKMCDRYCGPKDLGQQGSLSTEIQGQNVSNYGWCSRWWTTADTERVVVRHYNLPMASYRDAVWPKMNQPRPDLPCLWNGAHHPDSIAHSIMGDVIAYALIRAMTDSSTNSSGLTNARCADLAGPTRFYQQMESMQYCKPPSNPGDEMFEGTFMSDVEPSSFHPLLSDNWEWREDVPGKPGWIYERTSTTVYLSNHDNSSSALTSIQLPGVQGNSSTPPHSPDSQAPNNTIWFRVKFSSQPQLQVTYLTSYTKIGAAELTVHNITALGKFDNSSAVAAYVVDARTRGFAEFVSVPKTTIFMHPAKARSARVRAMAKLLPDVVTQGEYLVSLRPIHGEFDKFKLLGISSC